MTDTTTMSNITTSDEDEKIIRPNLKELPNTPKYKPVVDVTSPDFQIVSTIY